MAEEIAQLKQIVDELRNDNLEMKKQIELLRDEVSRLSENCEEDADGRILPPDDNDEIIDDNDDEIIDDDNDIGSNPRFAEQSSSGRILPDNNNDDSVDEEADCEANAKWFPLKGYENDYVIINYYPYDIKKVSNGKVIKNTINKASGYVKVKLNGKNYHKHVLVAKQFIHNDDKENKIQVDHINRNRADYHISNLRWASPSENSKNRTSNKSCKYEYVDTLPDDAFEIEYYDTRCERREIKDYYFSAVEDKFYYDNGINYRILVVHENKSGKTKFVSVRDINNKLVALVIARFKLQQAIY